MSQTPDMTLPIPARTRTGLIATLTGLALLLAGCSSAPMLTDHRSEPPRAPELASEPTPAASTDYHPKRNDLALFAMSLLDTPYSWGGRGPATGFDCSGLVSHVYREAAGLPVKGTSADLGQKSRPVDRTRIQPGDLVFFYTPITHVGIYVGDGMMVDAPGVGRDVRLTAISWNKVVGATRPG